MYWSCLDGYIHQVQNWKLDRYHVGERQVTYAKEVKDLGVIQDTKLLWEVICKRSMRK